MSKTVDKRSSESALMLEMAQRGRALMSGTRGMRKKGEIFLPKYARESDQGYKNRLGTSWLFNGFRKTVKDNVGRVFDKPVEMKEGPEELQDWLINVDLDGRDLSSFAKELMKDALSGAGISYVLVDAPRREDTVTQAQAQEENLRPYLIHLDVEAILGWRFENVNNVKTLTMLRIFETIKKPDPEDKFSDITVEQVRVMSLEEGTVGVEVYQKKKNDTKWIVVEEHQTDLTYIPLVPFYANRTGALMAEPLLDDLADVNIAHWQSQSDQRNILHYIRVPILHITGRDKTDGELEIGASTAVSSQNPDAKMLWVEHTGKAVESGRQDLKDLEFQMEAYGLQLLVSVPGQSATGEVLDAKKETSTLAMVADNLRDCLEQALAYMLEIGGRPEADLSVFVNDDFGITPISAQEMTVMLTAVNTGQMSRATFLGEMMRRGMIRDNIDVEEEAERIEEEGGGLMDDGFESE